MPRTMKPLLQKRTIKILLIKSVTIATRQKHKLAPSPLDLVLNGAKIDQVSEYRLLGITIDNKLRWDLHTNNVCNVVARVGKGNGGSRRGLSATG